MLSHQGQKINEPSSLYQVKRDTISDWFNRWESSGISGLHDGGKSGRPPKLSTDNEDHVAQVKALIAKENQQLDIVRDQLEDELSVKVSRKTLKRFF